MTKILIDMNEHTINCAKCGQGIGWMSNAQLEEAIKNGVVISDNATNGDIVKALFPHYDIEIDEHKGYVRIFYDDFYTTYPLRWWNTPYKAGDTDGNS